MRYTSQQALRSILPRPRAAILCVLVIIAGVSSISAADAQDKHEIRAHSTRVLNATDTAHLHYIHSSGAQLVETGSATGTLPGRMKANISIGATFGGSFTIYTSGGDSVHGQVSAAPHGSGTYESFRGSLTVTGGTGRYAHAHGHADLYGVFDRKTYALVVQTTGRITY